MPSPNSIPRTLIGVGGVRLINMPGVTYPDSVLRAPVGRNKKTGKMYSLPPEGYISTKEACTITGSTCSAGRLTLHAHKVPFVWVQEGGTRRMYWKKTEVEKYVASRAKSFDAVPRGFCTSAQAARRIGVSLSTLHRIVASGCLRCMRARINRGKWGKRLLTLIKVEDVERERAYAQRRKIAMEMLRDRPY